MSPGRAVRDSGRNRLSAVQADLPDFIGAVFEGLAIDVELTYGRCYATRLRPGVANVHREGTGGGFVGHGPMERHQFRRFLQAATPDDPLVRRGPIHEVGPR